MPNERYGNDETIPPTPEELRTDHHRFLDAIRSNWRGSPPGVDVLEALRRFGVLLYERSASIALVARGDRETLFTRHILDSLAVAQLFSCAPDRILDVGSGGGFPGIPLAILWSHARVDLLESRTRKCGFLEGAARKLKLANVGVRCERIEDLVGGTRQDAYDTVCIRALSGLPSILAATRPVSKSGAVWIYFLGRNTSPEPTLSEISRAGFAGRHQTVPLGTEFLVGRYDGTRA